VPPKRNKSVIASAVFFALFGCIAIALAVYTLLLSSGFLRAWVSRLPTLNYFLLIVGIGFLIASIFLWKSKRIGVYIGIISFGVAFTVNIYVAGNLFAHLLVGGFFGILLFLPLFFGWKSLT